MQEHAGKVSAGCSCCVFLFTIFAVASPYWVWTYGWGGGGWNGAYSATLGTGVYTAGYTTTNVPCGNWWFCYTTSWVNWEGEKNIDTACNKTACPTATGQVGSTTCSDGTTPTQSNCLTQMLEEYGMCKDNKFSAPLEARQARYLTISACVLSALATIFAILGHQGGVMAQAAGLCTLATAGVSAAAFSIYAGWDYANAVRDGKAGLILQSAASDCYFVQSGTTSSFMYGPAFGFMIAAFVISLVNTVVFFLSGGSKQAGNYDQREYGMADGGKYI